MTRERYDANGPVITSAARSILLQSASKEELLRGTFNATVAH